MIEVEFRDNREETFDEPVGRRKLAHAPRVGEYIWFPEKIDGHTSWRVADVAYWVGSGSIEYDHACCYLEPTNLRIKKDDLLQKIKEFKKWVEGDLTFCESCHAKHISGIGEILEVQASAILEKLNELEL